MITELQATDHEFIAELVNTPGWIRFIGDRNVHSPKEAKLFIQKILEDPNKNYWVVKLPSQIPAGLITFIKRDYLEHHDIGFAFLPVYTHQGYALEAVECLLNEITNDPVHKHILATTIKDNDRSVKLLQKLGLRFEREIEHAGDALSVFGATVDGVMIHQLTRKFFGLFTNARQGQLNLDKIRDICLHETIVIKKARDTEEIYNLDSFIEPRRKILSDGTLTEFEEYETNEHTTIVGNLAQRLSHYKKKGYLNGSYFEGRGHKLFQFVRTSEGWRINSIIWEDEES